MRALYAIASEPEASLPGGALVDELRGLQHTTAGKPLGAELATLEEQARAWAADEVARCLATLEGAAGEDSRRTLARRATLHCAPLGLVLGAWLQWLSGPANADDPVTLRVLKVYAADLGVGHPQASRGKVYLNLLSGLKLSEHASPTGNLPLDRRIPDGAFALPGVLLAMSRRPDDWRPEILGADLCLRTIGLVPPLSVVRAVHPASCDWDVLDLANARETGEVLASVEMRAAVDELGDADGATRPRVRLGFAWALSALRQWCSEVRADLGAARDPAYEMAELLRHRAREGAVYHRDFKLEGRALSAWLEEARTDPGPLLTVLARSRLVRAGRAEASALVGNLLGERGPMFRVFSEEDVDVISRWIDSLPGQPQDAVAVRAARPSVPEAPTELASLGTPLEEGRTPEGIRDAYHLLQTRHDTVSLRRFALSYIRAWLRRSRRGLDEGELPLPATWERAGLRPWLIDMHDRHGEEFEEGREVPVPSREALIDSTVQLAPLTLIDGSWLQGFCDYGQASSDIGHFLFETYWDELGNGEPRLNHPLLYREVLDEMDVHLPPTAAREFAYWPGFRDSSFELPVYWLCIGRFPQTFLPEVLGLNLAMELSGVGGSYRRAHIALRTYGFSTRFVDIHNTIDNVATGHSAWAADAVDTYMAAVPSTPGGGDRSETWERVRTGYRSLSPPPDRLWARLSSRWPPSVWTARKEHPRG